MSPYTNPSTNLYADSTWYFQGEPGGYYKVPRKDVYSGISIYDVRWADASRESMYVSIRFDGSEAPDDADTITADVTWDGRIQLTGDVRVDPAAKLTIAEGSQIVFAAADRLAGGGGHDPSRVDRAQR